MIDVLIAVGITAGAAAVIALLVANSPAVGWSRRVLALVLTGWFALVVLLGALRLLQPERLGTVGVGVLALFPVILGVYVGARIGVVRRVVLAIPTPALILTHAGRILGGTFLVLYAVGRLTAPFATVSGWGDIAVGCIAAPLALLATRASPGRRAAVLVWNALGLADLTVAVALGIASAPDSPLPLFPEAPGSAVMAELPMLLIPGFLVPLYCLVHLALFYRLRNARSTALSAPVGATATG
jgi:hypothetical protein